jgi:hypothetical protein
LVFSSPIKTPFPWPPSSLRFVSFDLRGIRAIIYLVYGFILWIPEIIVSYKYGKNLEKQELKEN